MSFTRTVSLAAMLSLLAIAGLLLSPADEGAAPVKEAAVIESPAMVDDTKMPAAEPKTFIVYFDFDAAAVDLAARDTLAEALRYAGSLETARVEIVGHTDRAGAQSYNERLAMRRAAAVETEMLSAGFTADAMSVTQVGETQPLVATADGVEERRNRRVEITVWA